MECEPAADTGAAKLPAGALRPGGINQLRKWQSGKMDWFKCMKTCEARGETCSCLASEQMNDSKGKSIPLAATGDAKGIRELLALRHKLLAKDIPELQKGEVYTGPILPMALEALTRTEELSSNPSLNHFCDSQLKLNELHFESYMINNGRKEETETRADNTDFYMVAKADTHLHLSALMTSPELFAYLTEIYHRDGSDPFDDKQTIAQVLLEAGFEPGKTAIDDLRTQSTSEMYRDFEQFNAAFLPFRSKKLADMLFKTSILGGKYLKEIVHRMAAKAEKQNVYLEPRVSIYARKYGEWAELAKWFAEAKPEHKHVLWAVQCPRVYHVWKKMGMANFGELLKNFFGPLFEATKDPDAHPELAALISQIRCIDTVDNEAVNDAYEIGNLPPAGEYDKAESPPYSYFHFYFWANLRELNRLREDKGLNSLRLRPHAGEAGPVHHLQTAFLFCDGISHGINLKQNAVLQYLYYIGQIGISVSPISNACLFVPYAKNPFPKFFRRGLCVTLTTDDPLQFHMSTEPQLEEYTTAKHAWNLSMTDLSEVARNSVLISSMSDETADALIGGEDPCDASNIPRRRFDFRFDELVRNSKDLGIATPVDPWHMSHGGLAGRDV